MSLSFELAAEKRSLEGTGASRRLRNQDKVPGVVYGAGKEPMSIMVNHDDILHSLDHEAFYSHILTLTVDGAPEKVVLKDIQRHPFKPKIAHLDFMRVSDKTRIRMHVPLHFVGADVAPGVKLAGGIVTHMMNHVDVICEAKDLPEYLEVDLSNLQAGHSVHLSDIKLPAGVQLPALQQGADHDLPVAAITVPRGAAEEAAAAPTPEAGGSTPSA